MSASRVSDVESCLSESGWEREIEEDYKRRGRVRKIDKI